jgi:excisionase family DNA binding protein
MKSRSLNPSITGSARKASLSPNEVGKLLGVTGEAVKQWIHSSKLPAVKLTNGYWRINRSELQRFIDEREQEVRSRVLAFVGNPLWTRVSEAIPSTQFSLVRAQNYADALLKVASWRPSILLIDLALEEDAWRILRHKSRDTSDKALVFTDEVRNEAIISSLTLCRTSGVMLQGFSDEELLSQLAILTNGR